ncbi:hypothetical protein LOTGIDRAFT_230532 [Lottia gigantea]|uniref:Uridylate-specific endoribonuclease n=1 Tax=Lottia gigantea TaxID=225164 RepID=V4B3M8_LOTGI|nr:hypothetical protein LOTGIDRAFT_230532 [Lottia gigantea]ESP01981.1 hypothetical protein LOTGIDRAFT_230532 [Lottia gigantea]
MLARCVTIFAVVGFAFGSTSCVGRCNDPVDQSLPCQCNSACTNFGDCCSDYDAVCLGQSDSSCAGRCGSNLDSSKPCQCNSQCKQFNDCCNDYDSLCGGGTGSGDLTTLMEDLWASDVNRYPESEYTLNIQTKVTDSNRVDQASQRLFQSVNEAMFALPTYATFITLLDNYNINVGQQDSILQTEWQEINAFLDAILETSVMQKAYNFLHTNGYVPHNDAQWRETLTEMWFNLYPRSSKNQHILDSSGFEHILVGELKSSSVGGFHNWIQFYLEEKPGRLDYTGWVSQGEPRTFGSQFRWNAIWKGLGSFFVGVSPEFDIAVYSVCALVHTGKRCSFTLNGSAVSIQTYDIGHKAGLQLATAYPIA